MWLSTTLVKCVYREGWRRSVEPNVWENEKYYILLRKCETSYMQYNKENLTGLVTLCVETDYKTPYWRKDRRDGKTKTKIKMLPDDLKKTRSYTLENLLWKKLWSCRKTDCGMMTYDAIKTVVLGGQKSILLSGILLQKKHCTGMRRYK
jgi:hypothetical protein